MGADMCLTVLVIEDAIGGPNVARNLLIDMIGKLDLSTISDNEINSVLDPYNELDDDEEFNRTDPEVEKKFRDECTKIVNELFDRLGYRDVGCVYLPRQKCELYMTGGMTWGDEPTESYEYFERFFTLPSCVRKIIEPDV